METFCSAEYRTSLELDPYIIGHFGYELVLSEHKRFGWLKWMKNGQVSNFTFFFILNRIK